MTEYLDGRGHSTYEALQATVEHRFSQGLALLFAYTHSKMIDNVGDYFTFVSGGGFQDNYCPSCDRSISAQDLPDVLRISGTYELPFGPGKPWANKGVLSRTVGGWSVGSFFTYDNGLPTQVTSPANAVNSTNVFGGSTPIRPTIVPGVSASVPGGRHIRIGGPAGTVSQYFNPAAFSGHTGIPVRQRTALCGHYSATRHPELRHTGGERDSTGGTHLAEFQGRVFQRLQSRAAHGRQHHIQRGPQYLRLHLAD